MSSERDMRRRVIRALRPLHAVSIENGVGIGTPDINYADGWIECKSVARWPAGESTPLRVDHFTTQQRVWLQKRTIAGGITHVLLKVGRQWLLIPGAHAAVHLGHVPQGTLFRLATASWEGNLDEGGLLYCLRRISDRRRSSTSGDGVAD